MIYFWLHPFTITHTHTYIHIFAKASRLYAIETVLWKCVHLIEYNMRFMYWQEIKQRTAKRYCWETNEKKGNACTFFFVHLYEIKWRSVNPCRHLHILFLVQSICEEKKNNTFFASEIALGSAMLKRQEETFTYAWINCEPVCDHYHFMRALSNNVRQMNETNKHTHTHTKTRNKNNK